jgi:hypothetical protein
MSYRRAMIDGYFPQQQQPQLQFSQLQFSQQLVMFFLPSAADFVLRKVFGEFRLGVAIDRAEHVFAPLFHMDQACISQLLQMEAKGRRYLFHPQHVATNFTNRWSRGLENVFSIFDSDSTATFAQEAVDSQSGRVR